MKIFFFTTVFAPSVGGIEKSAEVLCAEFVKLGHEVHLATLTRGGGGFSYPVTRCPSLLEFLRLLRWCDVHVQANVALKHAWLRFFVPRKFVYCYANAYQRDDGTRSLVDHFKATLARCSTGIANSHYTARRTGAAHVVLNAYDDSVFRNERPWREREGDLVFLGRLVSQKGCDTLLRALGRLAGEGTTPQLTIVGDGPERGRLEALTLELGLAGQVHFMGEVQGRSLSEILNNNKVIVIPSSYEEPFGIVALEGLACGCIPIVSERGGLVDAISGHGFTFPNGDDAVLANVLVEVLCDPEAAQNRLIGVEMHLARCTARSVAEKYIEIFRSKTETR